jgi:hypothetical protein
LDSDPEKRTSARRWKKASPNSILHEIAQLASGTLATLTTLYVELDHIQTSWILWTERQLAAGASFRDWRSCWSAFQADAGCALSPSIPALTALPLECP